MLPALVVPSIIVYVPLNLDNQWPRKALRPTWLQRNHNQRIEDTPVYELQVNKFPLSVSMALAGRWRSGASSIVHRRRHRVLLLMLRATSDGARRVARCTTWAADGNCRRLIFL